MGKKILALATLVAFAVAVLALFGSKLKLNDDAFAVTGFAVSNSEGRGQTPTPADRITEDAIRASEEAVVVKVANAAIGKLESTNSMEPMLDSGSNVIMIKPQEKEDLKKGDIIAYHSEETAGLVVHRVVRIGEDKEGWYAITKGDHATANDPAKVRFGQVMYVIIGILY